MSRDHQWGKQRLKHLPAADPIPLDIMKLAPDLAVEEKISHFPSLVSFFSLAQLFFPPNSSFHPL